MAAAKKGRGQPEKYHVSSNQEELFQRQMKKIREIKALSVRVNLSRRYLGSQVFMERLL